MRRIASALAATALVTAGGLLSPPASLAAVSLGAVTAASFGASLPASGQVDSDPSTGAVPVVGVGTWSLTATGGGSGAAAGKLALVPNQQSCGSTTSPLTNPLQTWATASVGTFTPAATTGAPATLGGSPASLGTGSDSATLTVHYRQVMASGDQLQAACQYTETTTLTVG